MVNHEVPSWNQAIEWLRNLESLRTALRGTPANRQEAS
jgi:hypothetical protein